MSKNMENFVSSIRIFLVALIFALTVNEVFSCGGRRSCSWKTCSQSYSAYSPNPSTGSCVYQISRVSHRYSTHSRGSGCPGSTNCYGRDQGRTLCSCKQMTDCWWSGWGAWSGHIPQGTCGKQRRTRAEQSRHQYIHRVGSCNGIKNRCTGTYNSEERTWCSCKKATSCPVVAWTSWIPAVSTGNCVAQTRHQDKVPRIAYVQQQSNCNGIIPTCYPMRITDKRTFCSCQYKECIQGAWTSWEIHSWTGNCPNERRLKNYRTITKYKDAYTNCNGIGPQSCPTPPNQSREKEVTCPKLHVPTNALHLDAACDGANSKCNAPCRIDCKSGYNLVGNKYVSCHGSGKWDRDQGKCIDSQPPDIKCPNVPQFLNEQNENFATIDLLEATAIDNSRQPVKITKSHTSPLKVYVGSPVQVRYLATDVAGNVKTCFRTYTVLDREPPKVTSCPEKFRLIQTGNFPHQVFWGSPTFHDNVDAKQDLTVIPSHDNGSRFSKGKHTITVTARDKAFNSANCTFTIELEMLKCPVAAPPKHGSAQCNIKKDGVHEAFICTVACKKGSWFIQGPNLPALFNFYVCAMDGNWGGTDVYDMYNPKPIVEIPRGKPIWPDCSVGLSPDGAELDMQVFGGKCTDTSVIEKLKQDFLTTLVNDLILNYLFCMSNTQNCAIENIIVYCSKRKRRNADGSQSSQMVVKFSFAVRNKGLASKTVADMSKLRSMSSTLDKEKASILKKVQAAAPRLLKDYTTSVSAQNAVISCEPGYQYKVLGGDIKCLKCPHGTYFDGSSRKCVVCESGYFQDQEGSLSCKKCPAGKSTSGVLASDSNKCKAICQPGTYSEDGLETCLACPIATYQPLTRSTSCISCPSGKVTSQVGSTQVADCTQRGIQYRIHSEGCSDPGIKAGTCGISTITVDGNDHSKHGRGINFVAIDPKTGIVRSSDSFDWHGDSQGCNKALAWLNNLPDNTIVLGAYQDEATNYFFTGTCDKALELIGGKRPFQNEFRGSFTLAGYKGKQGASWVQQKKSPYGRGPTDLNGNIELQNIQYRIHSEGCDDPGRTGCGRSTITVDGNDYSKHGRGINFVVVDPKTGSFRSANTFDWHGDSQGCNKALAWLNNLPDNIIVLGAYQDEASNMFPYGNCDKALELIGGKRPFQDEFRGSFALAGYKGTRGASWVQQKKSPRYKGPTDLKGDIKLI